MLIVSEDATMSDRLELISCQEIAAKLGLTSHDGVRFYCPICQPLPSAAQAPDLVVHSSHFKCSACSISGDVMELVQISLHFGFREATEYLAGYHSTPSI